MGVTQVRLQRRTGVRDYGCRLGLQNSRGLGSARWPEAQWDFGERVQRVGEWGPFECLLPATRCVQMTGV